MDKQIDTVYSKLGEHIRKARIYTPGVSHAISVQNISEQYINAA